MLKLGFLHGLLFYECDDLASRTFHTLASQDIYSIRIVLQCLSLDSKLGTKSVATILNSNDPSLSSLKIIKKSILKKDDARV